MARNWSLMIDAAGREWRLFDDGTKEPHRWYHAAATEVREWWATRDWRRRQREFARTGTRYYGDGGTIDGETSVNVEIHNGRVVGVWFRCQLLPFTVHEADADRAWSLRGQYRGYRAQLRGVEIKD